MIYPQQISDTLAMFKRLKRMLRCSCLSRERGNADYEYELLNLVNFISETSTTRQRIQVKYFEPMHLRGFYK